MAEREWDTLTAIERAFFVNAMEMDILQGVFGDLTEAEQTLPLHELADVLLSLVDQGLIEVRRYASWVTDDGREGLTPGDVVPLAELIHVLANPTSWEYPEDSTWVGALTLVRTDAGLHLSRL
ncbi:hypothetical protein [Catellatospora methionotrophica]|uniref:hypothetical protein n=1 Tax=Catellatospora methionotrophica TaxID=121620 RepID=UPI003408A6AB